MFYKQKHKHVFMLRLLQKLRIYKAQQPKHLSTMKTKSVKDQIKVPNHIVSLYPIVQCSVCIYRFNNIFYYRCLKNEIHGNKISFMLILIIGN